MLINKDTGNIIASRVFVARKFWPKLKGLQFKQNIPPDFAYIIENCSSIHTCFMRFDLDAVLVDGDWKVLWVYRGLKPFKMTRSVKGARAVIELKHGNLQVEPGHRLELIG